MAKGREGCVAMCGPPGG